MTQKLNVFFNVGIVLTYLGFPVESSDSGKGLDDFVFVFVVSRRFDLQLGFQQNLIITYLNNEIISNSKPLYVLWFIKK